MTPTIELMKNHRSVRKFKDQSVSSDLIEHVVSAAICASTSSHLQPYSIINVDDQQTRADLCKLAHNQKWITQAPVFLVFCADWQRNTEICATEDSSYEKGYAEHLLISTIDTSLVAQNTMLAAESLGLGGVFIGGIRNKISEVASLLDIPTQVMPLFGMCLGWPDEMNAKKPRLPIEVTLHSNRFTSFSQSEEFNAYDRQIASYYKCRDPEVQGKTWSKSIAERLSHESRPHIFAFMKQQKLLLK